MPELRGRLTPRGNLGGTLNTIVYASNYNVLDNKPSINSVTLQGNKTASDLGLATPADITVTSVNGETGAVVLDGSDINYDVNTTVNSKLDDLQSQIDNSGVLAVNGKTGVVILTGTDINYSAGVTLNAKIDAVEAEIPTVNYPVTSVNGETGAVVLDGTDIKYDTNTTIKAKIDAVEAEIPTVNYPVTSVNGETGAVVIDGTDINYDTNTTINAKIDAVQGNIPTTDNDITHYTGTPTAGSTAEAINKKLLSMTYEFAQSIGANTTYALELTRTTASIPTGAKVKAVFLQERLSSAVTGMFYSMSINETGETFAKGVILNPNSSTGNYYLRMTILYTY